MSESLSKEEVVSIFDRFSFHMLKSAITQHQRDVAVGISRLLWLHLVSGTDTEQNIYQTLNGIFKGDHGKNAAIGSLYFFKMKSSLRTSEISRLKTFYSDESNLELLKAWGAEPTDA
jgi:hypothetical protein